jgi:hypothetical protein
MNDSHDAEMQMIAAIVKVAGSECRELYRALVSSGEIFRALRVLHDAIGALACGEQEQGLGATIAAWCFVLKTRPRPRAADLIGVVASAAASSFLRAVSETRGEPTCAAMALAVASMRHHVPVYESYTPRPPVCFCRTRGLARNKHFIEYMLRCARASPDGCAACVIPPLHSALADGNDFLVRALIESGTNVNATGPGLITSMHRASTEEHMFLLLRSGFLPSGLTSVTHGDTAWAYHRKRGTGDALRSAFSAFVRSASGHDAAAAAPVPSDTSDTPACKQAKRSSVSIAVVPRASLRAS